MEDLYDDETSPRTLIWKTLKDPYPDGTQVLVMTCDICSSSDIIEDLTSTGSVERFWDLLGDMKHAIAELQKSYLLFYPYKFTGDGWIFMFKADEIDGKGDQLFGLMLDFSRRFHAAFEAKLREALNTQPKVVGINFGLDCGPIFYARFLGKDEYIGRPIGVACRLQAKLKELGGSPAYKALVSAVAYANFLKSARSAKNFRITNHNVELRNVNRDVPFQSCKQITLIPVGRQKPPEHKGRKTH